MKSVTVLVTCKNSISTIENCVKSLLALEYPNYKIFFVDAFSNDGTYELLKKYSKNRKIILSQVRGNPPTAYNFALGKIKTEFTAFTNADCVADREWLKELLKPFEDNNVNATAGIALNPKNIENKLQYVIGKELEYRYRNFPEKISRAPDMSLCVRTNIARKMKFNTRFDVSYDADFGYRMTSKYGKIVFTTKAIVYHYHRATWRKYFKQQFTYAKFVPLVYSKHKSKMMGDHISKPSMLISIINLYFILLFLLLSPLSAPFFNIAILLSMLFFVSFLLDFNSFMENEYFLYFLAIFVVRTAAWCVGLPIGTRRLM